MILDGGIGCVKQTDYIGFLCIRQLYCNALKTAFNKMVVQRDGTSIIVSKGRTMRQVITTLVDMLQYTIHWRCYTEVY